MEEDQEQQQHRLNAGQPANSEHDSSTPQKVSTNEGPSSMLMTDQIITDPSQRIRNFLSQKFNVEDIRELELIPAGEESEGEEDLTPPANKRKQYKKLYELYDIISVVGAGGFGIVIACRDRQTNKKFALKIAAQDFSQAAKSLMREKAILSKMSHPNIIRVYEMRHEYKNLVIMKMELGKESISKYLEKHQQQTGEKGLPEEQCAKIMKGLFRALAFLHEDQNVIHRDIKPDNIILSSSKDLSRVKLVDFGLAVQDSLDTITDFAKCGTFLYKPPEQVTNIFAYAKKADVWAAGIIMYYLLTGRHPIWKQGVTVIQMEQLMKNFKEFQYPSSMSRQAQHLISCLCQKNQSARYRPVNALQHPFITRKLDQDLPLSDLDRRALAIKNQPIEEKLRKAMRVLLVCAISRPGSGGRNKSQNSHNHNNGNNAGRAHNNLTIGGGGSSSTTQEETQQEETQHSSGSLLNGQQLQHYKQMIMAIDGDAGSCSSRNQDDDDEMQSNDEDGASCKSGGDQPEGRSRKNSFNVFGRIGNARDTTPKSHQRSRAMNERSKRATPKGQQQPLSQMGESEYQQNQANVSEKEDDYYSTTKQDRHGQTTTQKNRKQGLKKGKPPIQKSNTTTVKVQPSQNYSKTSDKNLSHQGTGQIDSFTGALDNIFTKQKAGKLKRDGSSASQKWKGANDGAQSDKSCSRVDDRSLSRGSVKNGGRASATSQRKYSNYSAQKDPLRSLIHADAKLDSRPEGSFSDRSHRSRCSSTRSHKRAQDSDDEETKYIIDGPQKDQIRFDGTELPSTVAVAPTEDSTIVSRNERKGTIQDTASKDLSVVAHPHKMSAGPKRSQIVAAAKQQTPARQTASWLGGGTAAADGAGNYSLAVAKLNALSSATETKQGGRKKRNLKHSNVKTQRGSQMDVRAATNLSRSSKESGGTLSNSRLDDLIGAGLLEGKVEKLINIGKMQSEQKPDYSHDSQQQNRRQREILSSAESSTNHFITKTHVGGALKNTRQVIAPVGVLVVKTNTNKELHLTNGQQQNLFTAGEEKQIGMMGTALNNRKSSKLRRDKFSSIKKQGQQSSISGPTPMEAHSMKLPGIKTQKQTAAVLYSAKHSSLDDNASLTVQRQHSLVNQTSLNYPTGEPLTAQPKGLTPKRRQNVMKQSAAKQRESEQQKSSMSQLSPKAASGVYHQSHSHAKHAAQDHHQLLGKKSSQIDGNQKPLPPRSTQVAGTVIIQGNKAAASANKQQSAQTRGNSLKQRQTQLFKGTDNGYMMNNLGSLQSSKTNYQFQDKFEAQNHEIDSLLQQQQVQAVGSKTTMLSQSDTHQMEMSQPSSQSTKKHRGESSALKKSTFSNNGDSLLASHQMTSGDLNDRLMESPDVRSYVPLVNKKLNKKQNHITNSTENILGASSSVASTGPGESNRNYEQRQSATKNNARQRVASPGLKLQAMAQFEEMPMDSASASKPQPSQYQALSSSKQSGSVRMAQSRFLQNQHSIGGAPIQSKKQASAGTKHHHASHAHSQNHSASAASSGNGKHNNSHAYQRAQGDFNAFHLQQHQRYNNK